ncbi:hypothetical protein WA026_019430 [Henosepilachna vigintioctopunctata]|uniref:Uncharacterized protein n=1 Tax=Henosepilachna vigintioctopunctata TaxID=420089 RepID=A0AAW1U5G8_9CUCU
MELKEILCQQDDKINLLMNEIKFLRGSKNFPITKLTTGHNVHMSNEPSWTQPIAEVSMIDPCTSNTTEVSIKLPVRSRSRIPTDNPCSSNITCAIVSEQPEHGVANTECNAIKEITPQSDENDIIHYSKQHQNDLYRTFIFQDSVPQHRLWTLSTV